MMFTLLNLTTEKSMSKLKKLRKEANLTQKQLAEMSNCAESTICEIEKGTFRPNIDLAERLSKNVNSTIFKVFFDID